MPDTHPEIEKLQKALADILKEQPAPNVELVIMTPDEFLAYAQEQVTKAKDDEPAAAAARLTHLHALTKAALEKNAFDGPGAALPVYTGDMSRQAQTAYSEQAADGTEKGGRGLPLNSTEANPPSQMFGKSAAELIKQHAEAPGDEFKAAVLAAAGMAAEPESTEDVSKSKPKPLEWPRDLNADDVDTELQF